MDVTETLAAARDAHHARDWPRAYDLLAAARQATQLSADDLDLLRDTAWWLGEVDTCLEAGERAFRAYLDEDRARDAATTAFELAISCFLRADEALGAGWIGRAQRLLDDLPEGIEHAYLRYVLEVEGGLDGDDLAAVAAAAREVRELGDRYGDPDMVAAGLVGEGRARVRLGDVERGLRLLDESALAILHEDADPKWAGNLYCHLMAAYHELADVGRLHRWVDATTDWLAALPAAVLFTGICRVHRSQALQVAGEWDRAASEADRVRDELAQVHVASVAEATYQVGELRRLRGDLDGAERAYREARALGRDPQPGLARARLARGRPADAATAIRAALAATDPARRLGRARLRAAQVEIALAAGDVATAGRACLELEDTAATYGTSGLEAMALHARGAVALAEGHPDRALAALRAACRRWHDVGAPYDAARACVLLGRAYRALGDDDAAAAELDGARATFARLGATVDVGIVDELAGTRVLPAGLTGREVEVLALVATGRTNREVADTLVLAEKTIARHLSNIFTKIGVSSRTEAAAFAFEHGLTSDRG